MDLAHLPMDARNMLLPLIAEPGSQATFDKVAREAAAEWMSRRATPLPVTRRGSPGSLEWLERAFYTMMLIILREGSTDIIFNRLVRHGYNVPDRSEGVELFALGLRSCFAHQPGAITDSQRERVSKRAWHAYRHYVPPPFLAGFLKQIGSGALSRRAADGEIEDQFKNWVIDQRARFDGECFRGGYPVEIEAQVGTLEEGESDWNDS